MKKFIFYACLFLMGCKTMTQPSATLSGTIDFKSWRNSVLNSFENKTGYSKGGKRDFGTALGVVHSALQGYPTTKLNELFDRSKAKNGDWDRMFIFDFFIEGETSISITSIALYKKSKYHGTSFDGSGYYDLKYIPGFKISKLNPKYEYLNNSYLVISEFDKNWNNIDNEIFIGPSYEDVAEKILKIYDSAIFD